MPATDTSTADTSGTESARAGPGITGRVVRREALASDTRDRMYGLLDAHFEGVSQEQFADDLGEKNWVILLEEGGEGGRLCGFSTLLVYETQFENEPLSVVYSGDTIVRRDAWGSSALPRTWIACVNGLRRHYPRGRYYWLLITSGYRTYRFLPLFWRHFTPCHDAPTPLRDGLLLHHLAVERFGPLYDPASGVVRFQRPQALRDRDRLSGIPPERLSDPHVAYFAARNPGHPRGDELVCLCELGDDNLTAAGRRMVYGARGSGGRDKATGGTGDEETRGQGQGDKGTGDGGT